MSLLFITGASSGIGQALAKHYLEQGWKVAMVSRQAHGVQRWCEENNFSQQMVTIYEADVCDVSSIIEAGRRCLDEMGVPDVVIACAGISAGVDTAQPHDIEVMRKIYETNNLGMMATFQPFVEPLKQRKKGAFVGIASVAGIRGLSGHGAYCSSKAAVINYCESLRLEMREATKKDGVQVITILPGFIDTPMTKENDFSMPFMMSAQAFAQKAIRAIERQKSYVVIPWQMNIVAKLMRLMPNCLFDALFAGRGKKKRQQ